jgi:hypothetical protein
MTKKYWKDWQKRIGETENIYKFWFYENGSKRKSFNGGEISKRNGDVLLNATFHGNAVDLVIERHKQIFDGNTRSLKQHVENEYKTLHRDEIACIEFKK